jgi:subtilisin family serine protease
MTVSTRSATAQQYADLRSAWSAEVAPFGIVRVGGLQSKTAKIDAVNNSRISASIAVQDTGVDATHPDLNVVGGTSCIADDPNFGTDPSGHGTLVAGIAAAVDNKIDVVGVAPGARIYSVKTLDSDGSGTASETLCALDWVAAHAAKIDVVNFSILISAEGEDPGELNLIREGIRNIVARGTSFVVAAGNESEDAAANQATIDQAITVSAFADYDGKPGGLAATPNCTFGTDDADDHFASFSDYGSHIDLAAPGVCVLSTFPTNMGGPLGTGSGTSFGSPHVAGAIALYKAKHNSATPAQVRSVLLRTGEHGPIPGDPDGFHEPILNVSTF